MRQCYSEAHALPKQRPVSYEDFSMKLDWGPELYILPCGGRDLAILRRLGASLPIL